MKNFDKLFKPKTSKLFMLLRSGCLSLLNLDLGLEKQFEMFKFRPFKFVSPDNYVSRIPPLFAMPKKA